MRPKKPVSRLQLPQPRIGFCKTSCLLPLALAHWPLFVRSGAEPWPDWFLLQLFSRLRQRVQRSTPGAGLSISGPIRYRRAMVINQRLPASLTPLDAARSALLDGVGPVTPVELPLAQALRCIAAEMPPLSAQPPHDIAAGDGFAFCSRDLVGASSYSPLPLAAAPVWVEAGDAMPDGCDCVLDSDSVDGAGPLPQVLAEAIPGQGVRRAGSDISAGSFVVQAGRRGLARDLLIARAAGAPNPERGPPPPRPRQISRAAGAGGPIAGEGRRPRLRIVNIPGATVTADLIAESARTAGADVVDVTAAARDAASISAAFDGPACDLLLAVGGSGVGRTDATVTALAQCGAVLAH